MEFINYPAGEVRVTSDTRGALDTRELQKKPVFDFVELALAKEASKARYLDMFYVPYAREDRKPNRYSANSLKVFGKLINSLGFSRVSVFDPHSDVVEACIDNIYIKPMDKFFSMCIGDQEPIAVVMPDAGADKKYHSYYREQLEKAKVNISEYYTCLKERDSDTGEILGYKIPDDLKKTKLPVYVIDDLCDGGGTFMALADACGLPKEQMNLIVSHGIFSKGLDSLFTKYNKVITSDSIKQTDNRVWEIEV